MKQPVHPHIRGAYLISINWFASPPGSSPHTWGILGMFNLYNLGTRFIPTYVGHTARLNVITGRRAVHPHIRGAYATTQRRITAPAGSSPHTWGILLLSCFGDTFERFIPTYVGHTRLSGSRDSGKTVHPHIRGAYVPAGVLTSGLCGSSPHTWGIRLLSCCETTDSRFIPTYVGHTR